MSPQETLKWSKAGLAQSPVGVLLLSPGSRCAHGFVCALQKSLAGIRFDFQCDCSLPTTLLWLLICPSHPYLFLVGANILLSMVVQQLVVILVFSQKMSACPSSLPS